MDNSKATSDIEELASPLESSFQYTVQATGEGEKMLPSNASIL